jgi:gluconate 2-dehydrogenase gamma chain
MTDQNNLSPEEEVRAEIDSPATRPDPRVSRRHFLQLLGFAAVTGGALAGGVAIGTEVQERAAVTPPTAAIPRNQYPEIPSAPATPPDPAILRFFMLEEALVVDALCGRILPGTPDDPGAQEATVVVYIDNLLSWNEGFAEATYRKPPFAYPYEGDTPPQSVSRYNLIPVKADEMERYGYQSQLTPREVYRSGIAAIESYVRRDYDETTFANLGTDQQDTIIQAMLDGEIDIFEQFSSTSFFHVLRRHVAEGMFSDPAYGGNRDMVGWKLIGYPGAQRSYTAEEIRTPQLQRPPQNLAELHRFHSGEHANDHVRLPVSGSNVENLVDPHKNHP